MRYTLRTMALEDLPHIIEIEEESFSHPWSADYFRHELTTNRIAHYMVACHNTEIMGYIGIWIIVGEVHITTIAVRLRNRHQGIGEFLLISAIELAMQHEARFITLEVRESNIPARTLYERYGFVQVGLRHRYYVETGEDALIMSTGDISTPSFRNEFRRLKQLNAEKQYPCR